MSVPNVGKSHYRQGGTRGGADQFKWEDVKDEKYRENYLGSSLLAPVGRWCKDKDLTWWDKGKRTVTADPLADEKQKNEQIRLREELKKQENELMAQALGLAPHRNYTTSTTLSNHDMKLIAQRSSDHDDIGESDDRVGGLGTGQSRHHESNSVRGSTSTNTVTVDAPARLPGIADRRPRQSTEIEHRNAKNQATTTSENTIKDDDVHRRRRKEGKSKRRARKRSRSSESESSAEDERDKLIAALKSQLAKDKFVRSGKLKATDTDRMSVREKRRSHSSKRRRDTSEDRHSTRHRKKRRSVSRRQTHKRSVSRTRENKSHRSKHRRRRRSESRRRNIHRSRSRKR